MQENLPIHLQYRRDEEVVRAEQSLSQIVDATTRYLATKNHIQPKQFAEQHTMPMFAHMMQFLSLQHADLLRFVQTALIHQLEEEGQNTETLVGLPPDDVDNILGELDIIDKFLVKIDNLGGNKKELVEEIKKDAKEIRKSVAILAGTIQDFILEEEVDEGEEEEEFIELPEDEEEPLLAPDEADEPLIAEEETANV